MPPRQLQYISIYICFGRSPLPPHLFSQTLKSLHSLLPCLLSCKHAADDSKLVYGVEAWAQCFTTVDEIAKIDDLADLCIFGFLGSAAQRKAIAAKRVQLLTDEQAPGVKAGGIVADGGKAAGKAAGAGRGGGRGKGKGKA